MTIDEARKIVLDAAIELCVQDMRSNPDLRAAIDTVLLTEPTKGAFDALKTPAGWSQDFPDSRSRNEQLLRSWLAPEQSRRRQ